MNKSEFLYICKLNKIDKLAEKFLSNNPSNEIPETVYEELLRKSLRMSCVAARSTHFMRYNGLDNN